jgi:hypothetical protein
MKRMIKGTVTALWFLFIIFAMEPALAIEKPDKSSWPKIIDSSGYRIAIYQPQHDSISGNLLYSRAAVSVTQKGGEPIFGAIWIRSTLLINRDTRDASLESIKVLAAKFPENLSDEQNNKIRSILEKTIPARRFVFSMDDLIATMEADQKSIKKNEQFNHTPPEIIYAKQPSILILFDGDPVFKPVEGFNINRAINTPFTVLQDPSDKQCYLSGNSYWFKASDPVKGSWNKTSSPPAEVVKYQKAAEEAAKKQNIEGGTSNNADIQKDASDYTIPQIIVRTKPAELIQSDGEPNWTPIEGTGLLYIKNSEDNIFRLITDQQYYILISGRWYKAASLNGPWSFILSDKLPADFTHIPEGSEKDIVLASVAGTLAAKDALMDAQIPQTATVDRKTAKCEVHYDGDPKFVQIKGTMMYRAENTSSTVILSGKTYYVCDNAVWFEGSGPNGPWSVATSIPKDIQNIPPDDPTYNVKYVYIYESTPEVVYVGYLPGYMGCYIYGPTVIYGTGFYYPCWYGPYYYPRPVTYGFSMHYNPWTGWSFGFSVGFGGPAGWFSISFGSPYYHGGWWGPPVYRPPYYVPVNHYYGSRPVVYRNTTINVYSPQYRQTTYNNIYNNRSQGITSNQPSPASSRSERTAPTTATRDMKSTTGTKPASSNIPTTSDRSAKNNIYSDPNGNIYRQNRNDWQQNTGQGWQNADKSRPTPSQEKTTTTGYDRQQLDKQSQARDRGSQNSYNRANINQGAIQSGGKSVGSGSGARSGGGARRK